MTGPLTRWSRSATLATVTAVAVLLAGGGGYRALARHLARPSGCAPLPPGTLDRMPMTLGEWVGEEKPLPEAIVQAAATDAHISRSYTHCGQCVALYVAYGVQARDLAPHRPEVCYPGAGWTLQDRREVSVAGAEGTHLDATLYRFARSGIDVEEITILNYYIMDGAYARDVSALRAKAWRGHGGVRYLAQVQITCTGGGLIDADTAERIVFAFADQAVGEIRRLFPDSPTVGPAHARRPGP